MKLLRFARRVLSVALIFGPALAWADVRLPALFGDHMVLQQGATVPVWGHADSGEKVTVTFGGSKGQATAGSDGKWRVNLPKLPPGTPPGTLVVAGKNTVTISDVLVGDVWVCSGQSNMDFGLGSAHNWKDVCLQPPDDEIRIFQVPGTVAFAPHDDVKGRWRLCIPDPKNPRYTFTAVGYFFAQGLRATLKRPIGLIQSSYGGTRAQAWTQLATLKANPTLQPYAAEFEKTAANFPGGDDEYARRLAAHDAETRQMRKAAEADPAFQAKITRWKEDVETAKAAGKRPPKPPHPPQPPGLGVDRNLPSSLFNGMIAPLIPFSITGIIWYQGESNSRADSANYGTLLAAMITNWRTAWQRGNIPFLFVQLPNYRAGTDWPILREAQLKTLSLPKTGMAVTIDVGQAGNLHPPDKADIGYRLSLAARHVAYGEKLVYTGPIYRSMKVEGPAIRVSFQPDSVGGGLVIGKSLWIDPNAEPVPTTDLTSFQIAGADRRWVDAQAKIAADTVVVSSSQVADPVAVRYAWASDPRGNLYNQEGLPASPFRTDDWPFTPPNPSPNTAKSAAPTGGSH